MAAKCSICSGSVSRVSDTVAKCSDCGKQFRIKTNRPVQDDIATENVLFDGTPSQWTNLSAFIFCVFMALFGLILSFVPLSAFETTVPRNIGLAIMGLSILIACYRYIQVKYTKYHVTSDRIEIERGWISRRIDNLDMFRVKDVRVAIGIFDRIIGIGTVIIISTDSTDRELRLAGIAGSRNLYNQLKNVSLQADKRRGVVHVEV